MAAAKGYFDDPGLSRNRTPREVLFELFSYARPIVITDLEREPLPQLIQVANDFRGYTRPRGSRGAPVGLRQWSKIVGITLHQTATKDFAFDHAGITAVPAHAIVHRDGRITLLHSPLAYMQHAHALNGGTIGIEVACRAAGVEGDEETFWRSERERKGYTDDKGRYHPPKSYEQLVAEATDAQIDSTRLLCRYYIQLVRACAPTAPGIRGIWAHKQGRDDRTSDPG